MRVIFIVFLIFFVKVIKTSVYPKQINNKIQPFLDEIRQISERHDINTNSHRKQLKEFLKRQESDAKKARDKAKILQNVRNHEHKLDKIEDSISVEIKRNTKQAKGYYHMDPVLNQIRRHGNLMGRRAVDSTSSDSSSFEFKNWKDEFNEYWVQKKFEAINSTDIPGDVVNMVAARPSGVPCGDPNQYDVPWGSCMLPMQCDAEYRIYRGDYLCRNTQYVCCSLQINDYDMNQGFDVSFADSSYNTDSEEKKGRGSGSKQNTKRKKRRMRKRRQQERRRRKRQMKKKIKSIVNEIRKILNRSYRNSTQHRKRRTKLLKRYIQDLKKQYINDRKSVREIHRDDMINVDEALKKRLNQIKNVNKDFINNSTFRDIILYGTMNKTGARMLVQAYPELRSYLGTNLRREGGGIADSRGLNKNNGELEYDIEYGVLYY